MSRTASWKTVDRRRRIAVTFWVLRNHGFSSAVANKVLGETSTVSKCTSDFAEDDMVRLAKSGLSVAEVFTGLEEAHSKASVLGRARVNVEIEFLKKALADAEREVNSEKAVNSGKAPK